MNNNISVGNVRISTPPPRPSLSIASSSTAEMPKSTLTTAYRKHLFDDIQEPSTTILVACTRPSYEQLPIPGVQFCSVIGHNFEQIHHAVSKFQTIVWLAHTPNWNSDMFSSLLDGSRTLYLFCTLHQVLQSNRFIKALFDRNYSISLIGYCGPGRSCGLDHGYNMALMKFIPEPRKTTRMIQLAQ